MKTKLLLSIFFLALTACILLNPNASLYYALTGLQLWYEKMIPALLPFMILSGIMIRMQLTEGFIALLSPVLKPLFRVSSNVCYAMILGFLCGFPMGAKTVGDLYSHGMLSKREAEYLLAFCNNIGPIYFLSFALPLLNRRMLFPYLLGMYGLPFLYGLVLRYTKYRDIAPSYAAEYTKKLPEKPMGLFLAMDEAINSSVKSILSLGGYMILCNLLNLLPHMLFGAPPLYLAPLIEISGGLSLLQDRFPLYSLLLLPFGGFSCIAQTYTCIQNTPLSITDYIKHKLCLVVLTGCYYSIWFLVSPSGFLS